jgi:glyoxylase-like metal-dependent hydrolase (beta-lactamase superfamily II)
MSLRTGVKLIAGAVAVMVLLGGFTLWRAQRAIGAIDPPLPAVAEIVGIPGGGDLPIRLSYINTASQPCPRSAVLDASLDPDPDAAYVMGHAAFVLQWADGRIFLIDTGMPPDVASKFGGAVELVGAEPIEPHGSIADVLGDAASRVAGVAFTHLHEDHTAGIVSLCSGRQDKLPVYQTRLQAEQGNYTTRPGRAHLEAADCVETRLLDEAALVAIPGFPGLYVFSAAGHTPGSQVFVARMRWSPTARATSKPIETTWVFTGDVVNNIDGIRHDVPKPWLYSLLVVPEASERLGRVRRFIRELEADHGARLLVTHDLLQIEASGTPVWRGARARAAR